jgi:predicted aconitase
MEYKMKLTDEQLAILNGSKGEVMAKVMKTLVMYGDIFGAEKLVPVTYKDGHLVTSFGIALMKPLFSTMDKLIDAGLTTEGKFTVDPRPLEYENVKCNLLEKIGFHVMYKKQKDYEEQLTKVGLRDKDAFSCACYLDEVGNIPREGDVLSWAESSAVVYANSVLGAKCNRNSGMIELFGLIAGYVPYFGFLTEEGRRADWKVYVKTTKKPEAQILGSAIGMKVMEDVPYVYGLDAFIGSELDDDAKAYLKDFGAATASNGAVGLYHIDNLTPEAKAQGEALIKDDAKVYVIDDEELERVYKSYPLMWKKKDAKPNLCFIGCPHLTYKQLIDWTEKLEAGLSAAGRKKVAVRTIMTTPPDVKKRFMQTEHYRRLMAMGVKLASICPLMYTNNPMTKGRAIITNSNKLRTYSVARYLKDDDICDVLCGKEIK